MCEGDQLYAARKLNRKSQGWTVISAPESRKDAQRFRKDAERNWGFWLILAPMKNEMPSQALRLTQKIDINLAV